MATNWRKFVTKAKEMFDNTRTSPWVFVIVVASIVGALLPIWPNGLGGYSSMIGYVVSWYGGIFQAASGALVGFWFSRRVMKHNLSAIPDSRDRAVVALGICIFCGAMAIAVSAAV